VPAGIDSAGKGGFGHPSCWVRNVVWDAPGWPARGVNRASFKAGQAPELDYEQ
jgi:hypothetical protein